MTNGRLSANTISISSYWQYFDLSFITEKNAKHFTEKTVYFRKKSLALENLLSIPSRTYSNVIKERQVSHVLLLRYAKCLISHFRILCKLSRAVV